MGAGASDDSGGSSGTGGDRGTAPAADAAFLRRRARAQSGNVRIADEVAPGAEAEWQELRAAVARMFAEMDASAEFHQPSRFWLYVHKIAMQRLRQAGIGNFKIAINQSYHNFIPTGRDSPLLARLLDWARTVDSQEAMFATMEDPRDLDDGGPLTEMVGHFFPRGQDGLALYRTYVALLWDHVSSFDRLRLLERLEEPELGNPMRVRHRGKLVSQDLATSVAEANQLFAHLPAAAREGPLDILEVGAGYGRLAHVLLSCGLARRYVIVDIPPALYVSWWYLSRLLPGLRMQPFAPCADAAEMAARLEQADVHFLTPNQATLLPDRCVDLSVAISALHEMRIDQANRYLREMGRTARRLLFTKNYWAYENPADDFIFRADDYETPPGYRRSARGSDRLNDSFFIDVMTRPE